MQATAEATNLNGTGADMKAWLIDSDGNLAESRTEAETGAKLLGEAKFATPVVVTESDSFQHGISNQSRCNNLG